MIGGVTRNRLLTIVFSHFSEKARWALDYCGVDYEERPFMPLFSQLAVLAATRGRGGRRDEVSSRLSTPVLVTLDGSRLCDSTDIARWASAGLHAARDPLFPEPEVLDLVITLGRELGPYTRVFAYWHVLRSPKTLRALADSNIGGAQAFAFRIISPIAAVLIKRALGVTKAASEHALERVRAQVALAEQRLERSRYLAGDSFTAADLTFAALMAPVLLPSREDGYRVKVPALDELDPEARDVILELRETRAGAFALDVFRHHRGARYAISSERDGTARHR